MSTPSLRTRTNLAKMSKPKAACPMCGRVVAVSVPPEPCSPYFKRHMRVLPGAKRKVCPGSYTAATWGHLVNPHLFSFAEITAPQRSQSGSRSHDSCK